MSGNPDIRPIPLHRRISIHSGFSLVSDPERHLSSFALRRFRYHISGLELFRGRKVLEIGGTERINLQEFFVGTGADYLNVRLEPNPRKDPRVIVGDFMDARGQFDLVISLGVFELGAIDINFETSRPIKSGHSMPERVQKLASLACRGGFVVIGTINAPCLFDDRMLGDSGFEIVHRESPFYSFMFAQNKDIYAPGDRSELLILRKR